LQTDNSAFDRLQESERKDQGQGRPESEMHPHRRLEPGLRRQDAISDEVPDKEDHEVGRKIVGPVMVKLASARLAPIRDLEEAAKETAIAAGRATAENAALHRHETTWILGNDRAAR
jgi:hypothetical protein